MNTKDILDEGWEKVRDFQKTIKENEMSLRNSKKVIEENKNTLGEN